MERYALHNLDCAHCAADLEAALRRLPSVRHATVSFSTGTLEIEAENAGAIVAAIPHLADGVTASLIAGSAGGVATETEWDWRPVAGVLVAGVLLAVGVILEPYLHGEAPNHLPEYIILGAAYLLAGWRLLLRALSRLARGKAMDESFLMMVATLGAIAIHQLPEAAAVMLFYRVGELLQDMSVGRARRSVRALLELRPGDACVLRREAQVRVAPGEVEPGERVVVRPGERIPLDGDVVDGESLIDTATLTGEPVPRRALPGTAVYSGTINQTGVLTVRVTRPAAESYAARILDLVENAAARKAPAERFIARFAAWYTPLVVGVTIGVATIPPLVVPGATFTEWVYRGLVILVVSCPCALMLSIPLGYFAGLGGASHHGVLVKGANYLDALAETREIVFDKTGTLTKGVFEVTRIIPGDGWTAAGLLATAAAVERHSRHPIAESIRRAYERSGLPPQDDVEVTEAGETPGQGVHAAVGGRHVVACGHRWIHEHGTEHVGCEETGTVVHVVVDGVWAGYLVVADELRDDAPEMADRLRRLGVRRMGLLTGDCEEAAEETAERLGLDYHRWELLPHEKLGILEKVLAERAAGGKVAFVGDGTNDAPVLARADVGIAMGGLGSDAAIEAADVVLVSDRPVRVATAVSLARWTRRVVWQNILVALAVKAVVIALGAAGLATMWEAVIADVGVTVAAVLNSMRVLAWHEASDDCDARGHHHGPASP